MRCPKCNETDHNPAAKYCFRCGTPLTPLTARDLLQQSSSQFSKNLLEKRNKEIIARLAQNLLDEIKRYFEPSVEETEEAIIVKLLDFSFKMIKVEGGIFTMGTQKDDPSAKNYYKFSDEDSYPPHQVTLDTYYMGETVVTRGLWNVVMRDDKYLSGEGDDLPVDDVTWEDCQRFISELNKKTKLEFRLPTEAEWEIAARGGRKSRGYKYVGSNVLNKVGWSEQSRDRRLHPVKMKRHNELGLYDMSGNVWEWCSDWFGPYSDTPQINPQGPEQDQYASRVLRGGSWNDNAIFCYVGERFMSQPHDPPKNCGFRLALTYQPLEKI